MVETDRQGTLEARHEVSPRDVVGMAPTMSDDNLDLTLGPCHYGDFGEDATAVAVRPDGVGWIPVCEEHKERAMQEGYEIRKESDSPTG